MENDTCVQEFIKNSVRLLRIEKNQENNIRNILEFYQEISTMSAPEADMIKIFDGLESIKIIISEISIDPIYNFMVIRSIQDNFEKYFEESRYPNEKQKKVFQNYLKEKLSAMKAELELIQDIQKQERVIKNPRVVYFNTH